MFKKAESVFSLCIAFVCWDESEQAGEFQDAHGGVGVGGVKRWRLLGFVLEALWWSLVSQSLSLSATYPFLGKHPH